MSRNPMRKAALTAARGLERLSDGGLWYTKRRPVGGPIRARRRPAVFPDLDSFEQFIAQLSFNANVALEVPSGTRALDDPALVAEIARWPRPDRASLVFVGAFPDIGPTGDFRLWIGTSAGSRLPQVGLLVGNVDAVPRAAVVEQLVDRFTVDARGHRPGRPVLQPISMREAVQHDLQRKIAVRGAIWGAVAGAIVGGAIQLLG